MPPSRPPPGRRAAARPRRRRGRPGERGAGCAATNRHWPVLALLLAALPRSAARAWLAAPPVALPAEVSAALCAPYLALPPLRAVCVARAAAYGLAASPRLPAHLREELAAEPA